MLEIYLSRNTSRNQKLFNFVGHMTFPIPVKTLATWHMRTYWDYLPKPVIVLSY